MTDKQWDDAYSAAERSAELREQVMALRMENDQLRATIERLESTNRAACKTAVRLISQLSK